MNEQETTSIDSNLTQSQLLLWTGQKLSPESPLYNMVLTFEIQGELDISRFQLAFQQLVDQSDALRTVFMEEDGMPRQRVLSTFNYLPEMLDWSDPGRSAEDDASWFSDQNCIRFDLSKRLFTSVLIKKSDRLWIWYLNQHHLITDAWAVSVLYRRMAVLYHHLGAGTPGKAPALPLYKDYLAYEKNLRFAGQNKKVTAYWDAIQAKLPQSPGLYGHNSPVVTTEATRVTLELGAERSGLLRRLTKERDLRSWTQHLSLFNIFTSVLFAYLYRISAQTKLAIGTPTHNRATADFKETPGVFIEVLPLIAEVRPDDTFSSLLQRVRTEASEFLMNAQPGTATPALSQGFNVVLNYIHATFSDFDGIPVKSTWQHPGHVDPRHHLRLQVHDFDEQGSIQLHFDLNHDVFDRGQRQQVPNHFLKLLDACIEDRSQPLGKVALQDCEEWDEMSGNFGQPDVAGPSTVVDLFQNQTALSPDAEAVIYQNKSLSYRDLDEKSNQLAQYLRQQGIAKGERLAIYLQRTPEFVISVLGTLKAGCAFIPVASDNPYRRVQQILDSAKPRLVLTSDSLADVISDSGIPIGKVDKAWQAIAKEKSIITEAGPTPDMLAYLMFTSGSTGEPKGVMIKHQSLVHYAQWAKEKYVNHEKPVFPLFTSTGFDLTVTSLFVPLISGGSIAVFREPDTGPDLSLLEVIEDKTVNIIKLTPAHLALIRDKDLTDTPINTIIVGGEALRSDLAASIAGSLHATTRIFNEYGPTEATVGCVVHAFDTHVDTQVSVPIGKPIPNMQVYVLDDHQNRVPQGVPGELYLAGAGLADGYWNDPGLTAERFVNNKFVAGSRMYRTGDMARMNQRGELEFLGRIDHQVKIGGIRVEPGEIEAALRTHPAIGDCVVMLQAHPGASATDEISHCIRCGLPSNYPNVVFDHTGTCALCLSFDTYQEKAKQYFKTPQELHTLLTPTEKKEPAGYDCMMLLSGGKDSTYALAQLVEMGANVLAYTLDNGYISEEAKANINRVAEHLGVDHIYGTTPAMNAIFVDSLKRHSNVCNGCFKTLYTLSTQVALEKGIPFIVTGLSRGQFFETRLTEELFWKENVDVQGIDEIILNARKAYHRVNDAVSQHLDTSMFADDQVFEKVQFIDFYRYNNISMDEMMQYLEQHLPWIRPSDTGRSTNCLINQLGIFVHKKEQGYSNYAFPYSWDVRLGHKTRQGALNEINEEINTEEVHRMMREIGYTDTDRHPEDKKHLVAFYTTSSGVSQSEIRSHLAGQLPEYMIPSYFRYLESLPLTANGKIDRKALPGLHVEQPVMDVPYIAPETEVEAVLADIWTEVLQVNRIGIDDNFLHLGGNSLSAIRIVARIEDSLKLQLSVNRIFEKPTISILAADIEATIVAMLEAHKKQA